MSLIRKQDTNGTKPLLATGELGYDNYPAGGDEGRVYVGTGTENLAIAKKSEVTDLNTYLDTNFYTMVDTDTITSNLTTDYETKIAEAEARAKSHATIMAIALG